MAVTLDGSDDREEADAASKPQQSARVAAVIVAAGRGSRFGNETPKQYLPLHGQCALRRSIMAFLAVPEIAMVCAVINPDDMALYREAVAGLDEPRLLPPTQGGSTRAHSVRLGLESMCDTRPDLVLIHDAARPFVSQRVICNVIAALDDCDGACAALPVVDALWKTVEGLAATPVARDGLWRAQTPQGFRFARILEAHRTSDGSAADDVEVARQHGLSVRMVPGSERNYKITTPADLERALADIAAASS